MKPLETVLILLITLVFYGCAASPDVVIYVEKNVTVDATGDVCIFYTSNAEVKSDAKLEGKVNPKTDLSLPALP